MRHLRTLAEWRIDVSPPAERTEATVSSVVSAEVTLRRPDRPPVRQSS